ncbi:CoA transferase [Streptomyces sp. NPDC020792]|uniref:CoA transferase n=1 Tax=Streptomyces sp. NPDC020792 TaxID=3365089 RepID=UPI0037898D04
MSDLVTPDSGADRLRDWACSGVLPLTGHAAGAPRIPVGAAASWAAAAAKHIERAIRDGSRTVTLDGPRLLAERAALTGWGRQGRRSVGGSCRLLPTLDGWAAVSVARPDDPVLWSALIQHALDDAFPRRLADWVAAHSGAELDERVELLGLAGGAVRAVDSAAAHRRLRPGRPRPVRGMLVVDFSALWAGPLCAHLLGLAGAEVVKVEVPSRPDGARAGNREFYRLLHGGHRSVVLDPADPEGRRALHALVRRADVVIEASRPRALTGFGLDAREEVARGCVWVSVTARGRGVNRVGFGDDVAAASGLLAQDEEALPVFAGDAIADPLTGLTAAALVLSDPPDGGPGTLWDVAMADVVAATLHGASEAVPARVEPYGDGWVVDTGDERVAVQGPTARAGTVAAPPMGADTREVLRRLGITAP